MNDVNSIQIGGSHYNGARVQHWDFVTSCLHSRYLEGNITKYVTRYRQKNGLQDLQKAHHYLNKLIAVYQEGKLRSMHSLNVQLNPANLYGIFQSFAEENNLSGDPFRICAGLVDWRSVGDLERVRDVLCRLIQLADQEERHLEAVKAGAAPTSDYVNQG